MEVFKYFWTMLTIFAFANMVIDSPQIKTYQKQYRNAVFTVRNYPQRRIDAIYKIVNSDGDDYTKMEQIIAKGLY